MQQFCMMQQQMLFMQQGMIRMGGMGGGMDMRGMGGEAWEVWAWAAMAWLLLTNHSPLIFLFVIQ
jgi:hypothetical protein